MRAFVFLFLIGTSVAAAEMPPRNPLFDELLEPGLQIPGAPTFKLPPPLFKEGMDKAASRAALEKAAGKLPLELFSKRSEQAPFNLKIDSINDKQDKRRGQSVDLWFVVYAKVSAVQKKDLVNLLLVGERKGDGLRKAEYLTAEQLAQRGIKPLSGDNLEERYTTFDMELLDKVLVTGLTRNVKTWSKQSVVLATRLDERFAMDKQFPNRWRSIARQGDKDDQLGPPQPYSGMAGYTSVMELAEPEGALLVEMHFAFHEPPEWFGGPNLLRSKLPILIQENVRSFRRKLARE
jgi:hypothetical protein